MTTSPSSAVMALSLERGPSRSPLQLQLYDQLRGLILAGRLGPGAALPPSRALARELGVSRTTVLLSYDQLTSEGYVEGRRGAGTFVPEVLPEVNLVTDTRGAARRSSPLPATVSALAERLAGEPTEAVIAARPFRQGLPDTSQFPFDLWSRLLARAWRTPSEAALAGSEIEGDAELRRAIAKHLREIRGIDCDWSQVFVTSGSRDAIDIAARTLLDPGQAAVMENPCYPLVAHALGAAGIEVHYAEIDGDGIAIGQAERAGVAARLCVVTPSRQFPLGVTMSLARRLELLDWARWHDAWILEDDYDSEYRYAGRPLAALKSLDEEGRVLYMGTFSKVMFRGLRLGYLVLPESIVAAAALVRRGTGEGASPLAQPALARVIESGRFTAHVRRMRRLYRDRQEVLLDALDRHARNLFTAERQDAGMHLIARPTPALARRMDDVEACARAAAAGIYAAPLSMYWRRGAAPAGLLLGFAGFDEATIERGVETLAGALAG